MSRAAEFRQTFADAADQGERLDEAVNKRKTGTFYEKQAADYLTSRGYEILRHSYRCHFGEIDLIARDGAYLVFVEVKYRKGRTMGEGCCAVDARKQRRICGTAAWYLMENHLPEMTPCRFDVVSVDGAEISLIQDAFSYGGW